MAEKRPDIPDPMMREIRQRCGFGCVICGLPLYEYEHMKGWTKAKRHVASEITLLCDKHHREKTNGLLPISKVREANQKPFNKQTGVCHPYDLHYDGTSCQLFIGNNDFVRNNLSEGTELVALTIDRNPMLAFSFEQGHLFLTMQVYDDNGQRVLWIEKNELRYSTTPWDIHLEGKTLTVREGKGHFLTEIVFKPPSAVQVRRGRFTYNGLEVLVRPNCLCYVNNCGILSEIGTVDFDVAISVGERIGGKPQLHFPEVNRGQVDRKAAMRAIRARTKFDKLLAQHLKNFKP